MPRPDSRAIGAWTPERAGLPRWDRRARGGCGCDSPPSAIGTPHRPAHDPGMSEFLQQLVNGVTQGSVYALIALGYTMVYGILRLINFAHGDVYMLGAFFAYYSARVFHAAQDPNPAKALLVLVSAMVGCGLVGWIIERAAYRPVRRSSRLAALITAIGVSLLLENGGQLVFGADPKFFPQIITQKNIALGGGVTISNLQLIIL